MIEWVRNMKIGNVDRNVGCIQAVWVGMFTVACKRCNNISQKLSFITDSADFLNKEHIHELEIGMPP